MPVGHVGGEEFLEFFDIFEISGSLLSEVVDPDKKAFVTSSLIFPEAPEVKGVGNSRVHAYREVFHQHDIRLGKLMLKFFGYIGSVPDVVVYPLELNAFALQAGDAEIG